VLSKAQTVGGASLTLTYSYDAAGRLGSMTYPSGMEVDYGYDAAGQIASLNVNGVPYITAVQHDPFGPVVSWVQAGQTVTRPQDADGRLTSFTMGSQTRSITYDAADRITQLMDSGGTSQVITYDALDRLVGFASASIQQTYVYDANGNRTALTQPTGVAAFQISPTSNRLQTAPGLNQTNSYDAAGNLVSNGLVAFSYDAAGHMSGSLVGSARSNRTLYTTSGLGDRILKAGPSGKTAFMHDRTGRFLGEYGPNGAQEIIYLENHPVALNNHGQLLQIYADQIGAPRLINDTAGNILWSWDGDPFGNAAPVGSLNFNQRFPGQYFDTETKLNHNSARYYDSASGRYTQSDPIGLSGGINTYAYVEGNPLSYADPNGLGPVGGTIGGIVGGWGGRIVGGAIGTAVEPGGGTVVGAVVGGAAGRRAGAAVGSAIGDMCSPKDPCPPCRTTSGRTVPAGTVGYRPLDVIPDDQIQHGVAGSHHNIFIANQNPNNCQCFWAKQKYVLKPEQLPPGAVPVEPFLN
jgi:RHS repeat-associated protein